MADTAVPEETGSVAVAERHAEPPAPLHASGMPVRTDPDTMARPHRLLRKALVGAAGCALIASAPAGARAHTDTDLVAVPAGSSAAVALKPTHGCSGSPTIEVAIRAPLEGAVAQEVDGWSATSEPDGQGNTVLRWTGGSLPADATGSFPVAFTVPDAVGGLLTFPSVQTCASGEELAWIDGDPNGSFPAPRLLVLEAGSEPASSLEEVPSDSPGREQLTEIVDIDGGVTQTTPPATEPAPTTVPTTLPPTSAPPPNTSTALPASSAASTVAQRETPTSAEHRSGDGGSNLGAIVGGTVGAAGIAVAAGAVIRRRRGGTG